MGLFWDLLQSSQISDQRQRAESLEERVDYLEKELYNTRVLLHHLIKLLEQRFGHDIDGDGRVG